MEIVKVSTLFLSLMTIGTFGCSDFKDNGIGRVALDFSDSIATIAVNNQMECAKRCDAESTCMAFEYAGQGPGTNVDCTLRELPVTLDHFYTNRNDHRYYHKNVPEMRHIGCYPIGSRSGDRLLRDLGDFMPIGTDLDERDLMQHVLDLCAANANSHGYKIFTVQEFTQCRVWNDQPNSSTDFQGFIDERDGCHQQDYEPLVGNNDHMSVFEIIG